VKAFVVDTNVPVVANGKAAQADPNCVLACIGALEAIRNREIIVLDDGMRILAEYLDHLSLSGQPGVGDAFVRWVWQNQAVLERCERVSITPRGDDPDDFEEFPRDPELSRFHRDDHKFVAVALTSRWEPAVLNAVDSDWWDFRKSLQRNGVRVQNLCPGQFAGCG
jgi:hypothetical protein